MAFSIVDFIVGFLMIGAMVHVTISCVGLRFPSVFGMSSKANLSHGILISIVAVDIYFFTNGLNATLSNGMLMGMFDLIILYAIFGRMLHRKFVEADV